MSHTILISYYGIDGNVSTGYTPSFSIYELPSDTLVDSWTGTYNATIQKYEYEFVDFDIAKEYVVNIDFGDTAPMRYASVKISEVVGWSGGWLTPEQDAKLMSLKNGWGGSTIIADDKRIGVISDKIEQVYTKVYDTDKTVKNTEKIVKKIEKEMITDISAIDTKTSEIMAKIDENTQDIKEHITSETESVKSEVKAISFTSILESIASVQNSIKTIPETDLSDISASLNTTLEEVQKIIPHVSRVGNNTMQSVSSISFDGIFESLKNSSDMLWSKIDSQKSFPQDVLNNLWILKSEIKSLSNRFNDIEKMIKSEEFELVID